MVINSNSHAVQTRRQTIHCLDSSEEQEGNVWKCLLQHTSNKFTCWPAYLMAIITSISRNNNNRQVQQIKMKERKEKKNAKDCPEEQSKLVKVLSKAYMLVRMKKRRRNMGTHEYLLSFLIFLIRLFPLILVRTLEYRNSGKDIQRTDIGIKPMGI